MPESSQFSLICTWFHDNYPYDPIRSLDVTCPAEKPGHMIVYGKNAWDNCVRELRQLLSN